MNVLRLTTALLVPVFAASCASTSDHDTLADLRDISIDVKEEVIEGGFDKAIASYQRFLEETPESAMTPEAIRRLADLKIEKEYGMMKDGGARKTEGSAGSAIDKPAPAAVPPVAAAPTPPVPAAVIPNVEGESVKDFEKRAGKKEEIKSAKAQFDAPLPEGGDGLESAGARDAIALYKKLLEKYPNYERNDQVLYNMSRAHEELGEVEQAMAVMNRMVKEYPHSKYMDEVQFRRGEYFFTRKKFLDAEDAYKAITAIGQGSFYYELGLYKLGWAFYKQEMYEDALHKFIALLDHKVKTGFDPEHSKDESEKKRVEDTYRVVSLSFSNLGGSEEVVRYFAQHGKRPYEVNIYANLGEFYLDTRRYDDAAKAYKAFVSRNPYHKVSPHFDMRVIEIYKKGAFARLVIEASKAFATNYGLKSEYWKHFDVKAYPDVLAHLKTNLRELAQHYHALYQNKQFEKTRAENYAEASHWYKEFLESFPKDRESPAMNYQLADLLLENKSFAEAAAQYERTAYDYPAHPKAQAAGYAAVYAHRENVKAATINARDSAMREVIRISLKFADTFPTHEKAAVVLGAATDDLFEMKDYARAIATGEKLITNFPKAEQSVRRSAWLVIAHSSFELAKYKEAEDGYLKVLGLTAENDKSREGLADNLAASIYKQGEQASKAEDHRAAADHFLRIALVAPTSKIRPTAEFDAAVALMKLKDWDRTVDVLQGFRKNYPKHELQPDVTRKIAFAYKEAGKLAIAAAEYERIETETKDEELRRGSLLVAADLYEQVGDLAHALQVYRRFVGFFPRPLELALESRHKIANIHKQRNDNSAYLAELKAIVESDQRAGAERTDRTRYLGAVSALVLTEPVYEKFAEIKLVEPFKKNLKKKKDALKAATDAFGKLVDYQVGEVTGGATYYIAEIYYNFGRALMESERPKNLSKLELDEYELALEEQAYPFEEKSIEVHEKNLELLAKGAYSHWIDKSITRLAALLPARYAKFEESSGFVDSMESVKYEMPVPPPAEPAPAVAQSGAPRAEPAPEQATPAEPSTPPEQAAPPAQAAQPEQAVPPEQTKPEATQAEPPAPPVQTEKPRQASKGKPKKQKTAL